MALQKREKILAAATGVLLFVLVATFLFTSGGSDSLGQLRRQRNQLADEVSEKEAKANAYAKAGASEKLAQWARRSLPADLDAASSRYQNWLRDLVVQTELRGAKVDPAAGRSRRAIYYTPFAFTVQGRGTLNQLANFLYQFYSVGHLHKILSLTVRPTQDPKEFDLTISIEALSLRGVGRKEELSAERSSRLALSKLDDYIAAIVRRRMEGDRYVESGGLFAAYVPAPPVGGNEQGPGEPEPPGFDDSRHTYVSGIHEVDGLLEVWLRVRTDGRTLKLHEGEPFEVGRIQGKIARIWIDELYVEIEVDGQRSLVHLDDNLHERVELPD